MIFRLQETKHLVNVDTRRTVIVKPLLGPLRRTKVSHTESLRTTDQHTRTIDSRTRTPLRTRSSTLGVINQTMLVQYQTINGNGTTREERIHFTTFQTSHNSTLEVLILLKLCQTFRANESNIVLFSTSHQRLNVVGLSQGNDIDDRLIAQRICSIDRGSSTSSKTSINTGSIIGHAIVAVSCRSRHIRGKCQGRECTRCTSRAVVIETITNTRQSQECKLVHTVSQPVSQTITGMFTELDHSLLLSQFTLLTYAMRDQINRDGVRIGHHLFFITLTLIITNDTVIYQISQQVHNTKC